MTAWFAAPTALLVYVGMDLHSSLEHFMGRGRTADFAQLGCVGLLFHLVTTRGNRFAQVPGNGGSSAQT